MYFVNDVVSLFDGYDYGIVTQIEVVNGEKIYTVMTIKNGELTFTDKFMASDLHRRVD